MGAKSLRERFVADYFKHHAGYVVLDVGCGPADILENMDNVQYFGFDISQSYIDQARARFGDRGTFTCKLLEDCDLERLPKADLVLALGLLHHLDDETAKTVLRLAYKAIGPGGRLVTFDPCYDTQQNWIARYLVSKDRGQNVRDRSQYLTLAQSVFPKVEATVRHRAWIPYTHCFMECTRT